MQAYKALPDNDNLYWQLGFFDLNNRGINVLFITFANLRFIELRENRASKVQRTQRQEETQRQMVKRYKEHNYREVFHFTKS